jgi:hypothetical protein
MKIENRLSTLTNKIKENLSLLGDGCSLLTLVNNITQRYNTKINKYLELSVAMRNLWCLEKNSILPLVISATGIVPQSLFKNLKIR